MKLDLYLDPDMHYNAGRFEKLNGVNFKQVNFANSASLFTLVSMISHCHAYQMLETPFK